MVSAVAAAGLATSVVLLSPQAASAQTYGSCSGSVVDRSPIKVGSTVVAEFVVYYQSAKGGTNTACLYHRGPAYGVATDTMIQLGECYARNCTYAFDDSFMRDHGTYGKLAGPVGRTSTNGNCVVVEGWIVWKGVRRDGLTGRVGCP